MYCMKCSTVVLSDEISGVFEWCPSCNKQVQTTNWIKFEHRYPEPMSESRWLLCRCKYIDFSGNHTYDTQFYYGQTEDDWLGVGQFDMWCEIPV
jgi:hypothetical protein